MPICPLKQLLHRFDLVNVFEVFLPQLLLYPNPSDPLNGEAAALLMRDPGQYAARIRGTGLSRAALPCCLGLRVPGAELIIEVSLTFLNLPRPAIQNVKS